VAGQDEVTNPQAKSRLILLVVDLAAYAAVRTSLISREWLQ
jgi:hypothetical protein